MISVLVLTRNEAADLPGCLASVAWCDDVHVLDSISTDGTAQVARSLGAVVTERQFDNFANQRNAGLALPYKHPWVLILDADERVPARLRDEIFEFASDASPEIVAARMRRRDYLWSTWLKHAQISPFFIRLVRPQRVRYEREVNEVLRADGKIHELSAHFDHFPFSKGMSHWFEKHNLYSSMEAKEVLRARRPDQPTSLWVALFANDVNQRRIHQKQLFYRMPCRPVVKFIYMYFFRLALLDGRAGLAYTILQCFYEYMIVLKTRELQDQA